jgi:thymidine phosphorylase
MLYLTKTVTTLEEGRANARNALASGAGLEVFRRSIGLQEGDPRVCDDATILPRARETVDLKATHDGRINRLGSRAVGHAAMLLGAGRERADQGVDPAVGIVCHKKLGELVIEGEPILTLHVNDSRNVDAVLEILRKSIRLGPPMNPPPLIRKVIT